MLEEFISVALEAFINANGDVDKFELQLRRKLMTYNSILQQSTSPMVSTQTVVPPIQIEQVEKAFTNMSDNDPIFSELENLDVSTMTDEDVIAFARRLGLMGQDQSEEVETTDEWFTQSFWVYELWSQ